MDEGITIKSAEGLAKAYGFPFDSESVAVEKEQTRIPENVIPLYSRILQIPKDTFYEEVAMIVHDIVLKEEMRIASLKRDTKHSSFLERTLSVVRERISKRGNT